jgi:hypothetical protein
MSEILGWIVLRSFGLFYEVDDSEDRRRRPLIFVHDFFCHSQFTTTSANFVAKIFCSSAFWEYCRLKD